VSSVIKFAGADNIRGQIPQHRPSGVGEDRNSAITAPTTSHATQHRPSGVGEDRNLRMPAATRPLTRQHRPSVVGEDRGVHAGNPVAPALRGR
jgi:hypothetical protein